MDAHLLQGTYPGNNLSALAGGGYFGRGFQSVMQQNSLAADYVVGRNSPSQIDEFRLDNVVIDGNKSLGTFTGEGNGLDLRGFNRVHIGFLYVKNCAGHGVRFRNCANVFIDTLITENNDKFGTVFESGLGSLVTRVHFGKIISINDGHSGSGWTGIDFGDCLDESSGVQMVHGGLLHSYGAGRVGVAFGRNAAGGGVTGPRDITVSQIVSEGAGQANAGQGNGVEIFAVRSVQIGQIVAKNNGAHGVWVNKGDDGVTQSEDVAIGQISATGNGKHGVYLNGGHRVLIDQIISNGNSKSDPAAFSAVSLYGDDNASLNGKIHIGAISALGDANQTKGLEVQSGAMLGGFHIGALDAHGHADGDFVNANAAVLVEFDRLSVDRIVPSYLAGLAKRLVKVGGEYVSTGRTGNATTSELWKLPIPEGSLVAIDARITGFSPGGAACTYWLRRVIKRVGSGNAQTVGTLAVIDSMEEDAGYDATITVSGSDAAAYILITGLAATTVNWEAKIRIEQIG